VELSGGELDGAGRPDLIGLSQLEPGSEVVRVTFSRTWLTIAPDSMLATPSAAREITLA
jgi:hypothetical protein